MMGKDESYKATKSLLAPLEPLEFPEPCQIALSTQKSLPDDGHVVVREIVA